MASSSDRNNNTDADILNEKENFTINKNLSYFQYLQFIQSQQQDEAVITSTPTRSKDDYDDELIELVKEYKIIWNTGGRGFKDTTNKNQAWREIASKMSRHGKCFTGFS